MEFNQWYENEILRLGVLDRVRREGLTPTHAATNLNPVHTGGLPEVSRALGHRQIVGHDAGSTNPRVEPEQHQATRPRNVPGHYAHFADSNRILLPSATPPPPRTNSGFISSISQDSFDSFVELRYPGRSVSAKYDLSSSPPVQAPPPRPDTPDDVRAMDIYTNSMNNVGIVVTKKPPQMMEMVGDWILGRQLGRGSNGQVRLAKHNVTGMMAAIKIMHKNAVPNDGRHSPILGGTAIHKIKTGDLPPVFEREIAIMRLMHHPNIIRLLDVFESEVDLYLVMEFVDGGELYNLITEVGCMEEEVAIPIFRQILSALYFCQMINVTHRDLKPENILLTRDGVIKLADFGLGKITPKNKMFKSTCGSPHYIAPEIASFGPYNARKTDVWSLGCVLYTLLAGHLPFEAPEQDVLLAEVRKGEYVLHDHFSYQAKDLLMRMMCVNPDKRIKISQIWNHPLVMKYAPTDRPSGRPLDIKAGPLNIWDVKDPVVQSGMDIDAETMQNLRTLHPEKTDEQLVFQLKAFVPNGVKLTYCLLIKYRNENPQCYPGMLECEIRGGDIATNLLKDPPTKQLNRWKRSSTVSTMPSIDYYCESEINLEDYHEQYLEGLVDYDNSLSSDPYVNHNSWLRMNSSETGSVSTASAPTQTEERETSSSEQVSPDQTSCDQASSDGTAVGINSSNDNSIVIGDISEISFVKVPDNDADTSNSAFNDSIMAKLHQNTPLKEPLKEFINMNDIIASGTPDAEAESSHVENEETTPKANDKVIKPSSPVMDVQREARIVARKMRRISTPKHARKISLNLSRKSMTASIHDSPASHAVSTPKNNRLSYHQIISRTREMYADTRREESYNRALKYKRKSRELEAYIDEQAHWAMKRKVAMDNHEISFESFGSPSSMTVKRGSPSGSVITGFTNGSLDTSYTMLQSPRTLISESLVTGSLAGCDGSIMGAKPAKVDTDEAIQDLNHRLSIMSMNKRVANNANKDRDVSNPVSEATEVRNDTHDVYERISMGIARTQTMEDDDTVRGRQGPPSPTVAKPVEITVIEVPASPTELEAVTAGTKSKGSLKAEDAKSSTISFGALTERFKSLNKSSIFLPLSSKDDSADKTIDGSKSLPGQVRRKKSLMDLLKVKRGSSRGSKDADDDEEKVSRTSMISTLGRKTLDRLTGKAGKDSKKDSTSKRVPIQSLFEPPPSRAECSATQGEDSDEELSNVTRDELRKVVEQQGFLQRVMKKKPAIRMFCFSSAAADSRVELLDVFRYWKKIGVVIVQDDKKGLVMRAELSDNDMELKPCSIVGEIRVVTGDRKKGTSVARFTLEKGAVFSFTYLCDELFTSLNRRGIVIRNPKEVAEMVKVFDN